MLKPPIAIGLSPNTQSDDVWQAVKTIIRPWLWKEGNAQNLVEDWFKKYFGCKEVFLFNSGRSALYSILKSFGIGDGNEVLIQAFTCVAVPDPIIWVGAKPIYVDIDETLNLNPGLLEKYITSKTKAVIVQHTFGIPAKIDLIKKIAQKYNLVLIEDCAHALGAEIDGKKAGTFGDAAIFSFGRDKVISSVFGGAAVINGKWKMENERLKKLLEELKYPSFFWIFQQLLHPILFSLILPLYNIYLGKIILFVLQKLSLLSKPIYKEEVRGEKPTIFPKRFPNALAYLLLNQLSKLGEYNSRRKQIADYYYKVLTGKADIKLLPKVDGTIYLRFNILTKKSADLLSAALENKIILGNWYRNIIDPAQVEFERVYYKKGSCPEAERIASLSINLPTYPRLSQSDLEKIVKLFG